MPAATLYIVVLALILVTLLGVGIWQSFKVRTEADFMVAGRRLAWPVLVFTLLSSWIGAGSLFAGAENAFKNGFAAMWQPAGGWAGLAIIALIAGRARRFAQYTVPELLETRYNRFARLFGTLAIVIAYTTITSYQFRAGGDILNLIFPEQISKEQGTYIIAVFVSTLTALAGMASVAYLDLVVGLLVTITACIALPTLIDFAGGWQAIRSSLPENHFTLMGPLQWYEALNFFLPVLFLILGNQAMYQKFFSARSERDAKIAVGGWILGTLLLETIIVALAVVGSAIFPDAVPRDIIPVSARRGLPALLGALLLGGIFAKVISTGNNYLFSPAANLIHDVYHRFLRPQASQREILVLSRVIVFALGGVALFLAFQTESILRMALYAYTVYGAAITPAVMAAFFWRRATGAGAVASVVAGTAVSIAWNLVADYGSRQSEFANLTRRVDAVVPAVILSILLLLIVSLLTRPPRPEQVQPFLASSAPEKPAA